MIQLTPQQKKEYTDRRVKEFQEGLEVLLKEKGLKIFATLDISPLGITPIISLADRDEPETSQGAPKKSK